MITRHNATVTLTNIELAEILDRQLEGTGWHMFRYKTDNSPSVRFKTDGKTVTCIDCGQEGLPPDGQKLALHNHRHTQAGDEGVRFLKLEWVEG